MTAFTTAEQLLFERHGLVMQARTVGTTRLLEVGSGRPILYMHGGGGCAALWAPLVAELGRRVAGRHLMPDRPGCGLTPHVPLTGVDFRAHAIAFIRQLLDALELDRVDIVANSMGGLWSLWFALAAPARVRSLTLLGAPAFVGGSGAPLALRLLARPLIGRLMMALEPPSLKQVHVLWRRMGHDPALIDDSLHELFVALERLPSHAPAWRDLLARVIRGGGVAPDVVLSDEELAAVTAPTSIVWGARDPFGDVALGERIARTCNARFRTVASGHLPWLDQAAACAEAVRVDQIVTRAS
jgi:pimeloyl-ACP methyl ester carboxylesterase